MTFNYSSRQPLTDLAINENLKRTTSKPQSPGVLSSRRRALRVSKPRQTRILQHEQINHARSVFKRITALPSLAGRIPFLCRSRKCVDGRVQKHDVSLNGSGSLEASYGLGYPQQKSCMLVQDWKKLQLTSDELRRLCDHLITDVRLLHNAHVAYVPDVTTLRVMADTAMMARPGTDLDWKPFIDLDLDGHCDDGAVCWADLKAESMAFVEAQFAVLEVKDEPPNPECA